jgi:ribonuclease Z
MAESRPATARVTVLGSGDAFGGEGCNSAYLVDDRVLVDCGAPVHVLMRRAGMSIASLEVILLTHFHADHTFMLPMLLGARAFADAPRAELTIAGPVGTREYVRRLLATGYGQTIVRLIDERLDLRWAVLQDGSSTEVAGCAIGAAAVVHSTGPSLAYTVRRGDGPAIGFSGDSELCAGLRRVISASDLMVCECTGWDQPSEGGHLWRGELERLISEYPGTRFLLSHLRTRGTLPGALIARDLLSLDVVARS